MKKFVFASMVALAPMSLLVAPKVQAQQQQDASQISIKDPAEFNAYQMATTQTDPKQKAAALESFLKTYPQSQAKQVVLDQLVDACQAAGDQECVLSSSQKLLQVDPNNLKATLYTVLIKKRQCAATPPDQQACDEGAQMAQKGLGLQKPAAIQQPEWDKLTHAAFPIFHSMIAIDDTVKKEYKQAQQEYTEELKLYSPEESKSAGLNDTLLLAQAYAQPGSAQDLKMASWFFARVWDYAPQQYKTQIEPKLEYYYKKYHGALDGLDQVKQQAQNSLFPPDGWTITPAKSPQEQIHDLIAATPDLSTLALADKETILALGSKDDADKMWAVLQGKQTQVPGTVISATPDQVQVAVTQDAKDSKVPDFIVNMKKPLTESELKTINTPGFEFKTQPDAMLIGTYDTYKQVPATDTTSQAAQIVLKDGEYVPAEKKKPAAHRPATRRPRHH